MSNLKLAYHGDALADAIDCEFAWMKEMTTSGVFVAPAAMDNASQSVHSFETCVWNGKDTHEVQIAPSLLCGI